MIKKLFNKIFKPNKLKFTIEPKIESTRIESGSIIVKVTCNNDKFEEFVFNCQREILEETFSELRLEEIKLVLEVANKELRDRN